jgi:hypothetical protein
MSHLRSHLCRGRVKSPRKSCSLRLGVLEIEETCPLMVEPSGIAIVVPE